MTHEYPKLTFTPSVKEAQEHYGTRAQGQRFEDMHIEDNIFGPQEAAFIGQRDSFYMASAGEEGWPYVQYRGGPIGFLKLIDNKSLGYLDFSGNKQYISTGNLRNNDRVSLFLMDYPNRRRLKIMARTKIHDVEDYPELVKQLEYTDYKYKAERAVIFNLEAFDWNCPKHIEPRYTEAQLPEQLKFLLEENSRLRAKIQELTTEQ